MTISVIGAGLGRTGTKSLKLALEALGLGPCYHMEEVFKSPAAPGYWEAVADGQPDWETTFKGYGATVDWPSATFYKQLADVYPDAKVILTERDPEDWYRSTQATIFARPMSEASNNSFERMAAKTVGRMFDGDLKTREHVIAVYLAHNAEVRRRIAPERLLVYYAADGWGPLCDFLGVDPPEAAMPNVNSTDEFRARAAAMRAAAAQAAP